MTRQQRAAVAACLDQLDRIVASLEGCEASAAATIAKYIKPTDPFAGTSGTAMKLGVYQHAADHAQQQLVFVVEHMRSRLRIPRVP